MSDVNNETPNPALEWWAEVKRKSHNIFEVLDNLAHELVNLGVPLGTSKDAEPETVPDDNTDGVEQ